MREDEKHALIDYCEEVIGLHVQYGGDSNEEAVFRIALASLQADGALVSEGTIPPAPGWVMVPVEPTEMMIIDGFESASST